ncbi:MAG TPA: Gfo/Idh/MocA family oxidoreductase [Nitrososphaerales archaeon]
MTSLKLGLIGCGRIAQLVHLNVIRQLPNSELIALAEPDPKRREEASKLVPKAIAFESYNELLSMPEVEAVIICLPNNLHAEATVTALEHGKHVYLEKPLATSLKEAQGVLEAWRRADLVGMVGFNYRFNAFYKAARQHIESGRLGELVCVRSVFSTATRTLPTWKQARERGGGALLDLASHHIDLVRFISGEEIQEVFARVWLQQSEDDCAMLQLRLANGLLVQSFFSLSAVEEDRFEIYGMEGKLTIDRYLSFDVEITDPTAEFARLKWLGRMFQSLFHSPYLKERIFSPGSEPSYKAALNHFVTAVRKKQPTSPDFWDGYQSLAVIEAAEESARIQRVVSLADFVKEDFNYQYSE